MVGGSYQYLEKLSKISIYEPAKKMASTNFGYCLTASAYLFSNVPNNAIKKRNLISIINEMAVLKINKFFSTDYFK